MSSTQCLTLAWLHPQLYLLVEELEHVEGVGRPAVDTTDGDRAAPAHRADGRVKDAQAVDPGLLYDALCDRIGQEARELLRNPAAGEPCASILTASITESAPPVGHLADRLRDIVVVPGVQHLDPVAARPLDPHEIDGDDPVALMQRDATGHVADRSQPEDRHAAALGMPAYSTACQEVGKTSER